MSSSKPPIKDRVTAMFRELVGDRAAQISAAEGMPQAQTAICDALVKDGAFDGETAHDIAFHLTDWNYDAAFLVALLLFPERFTPEEICEGVLDFLVHAPNHVAAAAKLHGCPVADIFEIGALDPEPEDSR